LDAIIINVVIFLSTILVLAPNKQFFLDYDNIAFSERYVTLNVVQFRNKVPRY